MVSFRYAKRKSKKSRDTSIDKRSITGAGMYRTCSKDTKAMKMIG